MKTNPPLQNIENVVALALANGEVALWLGPDWHGEGVPDQAALAQYDWLGIWCESRDPATARFLAHAWEDRPFKYSFQAAIALLATIYVLDMLVTASLIPETKGVELK